MRASGVAATTSRVVEFLLIVMSVALASSPSRSSTVASAFVGATAATALSLRTTATDAAGASFREFSSRSRKVWRKTHRLHILRTVGKVTTSCRLRYRNAARCVVKLVPVADCTTVLILFVPQCTDRNWMYRTVSSKPWTDGMTHSASRSTV